MTLGHDTWRARDDIGDEQLLDDYLEAIRGLPDVESVPAEPVDGYWVPPATVVEHSDALLEAMATLVGRVGART